MNDQNDEDDEDDGDEDADEDENENEDEDEDEDKDEESLDVPSSTTNLSPAITTIAVPNNVTTEISDPFPNTTVNPVTTIPASNSAASTLPGSPSVSTTLVGTPLTSPSSSTTIENMLSSLTPTPTFAPTPTPALPLSLPSPPTTSNITCTMTSACTVYIPQSPLLGTLPLPSIISTEPAPLDSTSATRAPSLDLAPNPASSGKPLSIGVKAGIGLAIAFAIFVIVGAIVYDIYHRRRMDARQRLQIERKSEDAPRGSLAYSEFFAREPKSDSEWRIESASEAAIVRARSIETVGSRVRPASPTLPLKPIHTNLISSPGSNLVGGAGAARAERKLSMTLANLALRSNPPMTPLTLPSPQQK